VVIFTTTIYVWFGIDLYSQKTTHQKCCAYYFYAVNKFGSQNKPDARKAPSDDALAGFSTTMAICTLNFAIEGDSTRLPKISTRNDLRLALNQIAADAVVADCLVTAEVLWSPEDSSETLSKEEVYADFPQLVPI